MSNKYLDIAMEKVIKQEVNAVLDKIKAEIETDLSMFCFDDWGNENGSWTAIKEIIDKHISGKEQE